MGIKYEVVFGDQALLAEAGTFTGLDVVTRNVDTGLYAFCRHGDLTYDYLRKNPVIAMRRIIRAPTWTKADQKAGKLPEVGCEVINTDHSISLYVLCKVIYVDDKVVIVYNGELSQTYSHGAFLVSFKPIESPEEKAARLREDWCESALKIINHKFIDARGPMAIYDALLSGDLPVPVKGEQNK